MNWKEYRTAKKALAFWGMVLFLGIYVFAIPFHSLLENYACHDTAHPHSTDCPLCAETWGRRFLIAGLTGIAAALAGLLFGYCFDFSAGASIALFLVLLLVAVSSFQFVRKLEQP